MEKFGLQKVLRSRVERSRVDGEAVEEEDGGDEEREEERRRGCGARGLQWREGGGVQQGRCGAGVLQCGMVKGGCPGEE